MFLPGWCSLHRASLVLKRRHTTLLAWCNELNIRVRRVGKRFRYVSCCDLDRLSAYSAAHPVLLRSPPPAEYDPALTSDRFTELRTKRDHALARRIEASSRWKREHFGAYIGAVEMSAIERCL